MAMMNTDYMDKDMPRFKVVFTLVVSGIECLTGITGNGFVVAIHGAEGARHGRLPEDDCILLMLSFSRLLLKIWMMLENTYSLLFRATYNQNTVYIPFKVTVVFLNYSNLWLAVWLTVFYCLKIVNLTHPLSFRAKRKVEALMPRLLRLSLLMSLSFSFPFSRDVLSVSVNTSIPSPSSNDTELGYFAETNRVNQLLLRNLGIFMPLVMFIPEAALLITSLRRHTLPMGAHVTGPKDHMEAHTGAIRATSSFLVLHIFNAIAHFLSLSNVFDVISSWDSLCKVIMAAYPAGHSVLLISDNPGLRRSGFSTESVFTSEGGHWTGTHGTWSNQLGLFLARPPFLTTSASPTLL
ncbi:LOW QUALITY PROTEIN: taste receptor type 2 member 40-like [Molossus nigricans]